MNEPCSISSRARKSGFSFCRLAIWITTMLSSLVGISVAVKGFEVSMVGMRWKLMSVRENCGQM